MRRSALLLLPAAAAAALSPASPSPSAAPPIWADGVGADPGRTFQSPSLNGPLPATPGAATGALRQAWNWTAPAAWRWYDGAIGSDGSVFFFSHGRAQTAPALHKIVGTGAGAGTQAWRRELPIIPFWPDGNTGNDHLLLSASAGLAVAIPGVSWYNLPRDAYVAALSTATGELAWVLNLTAAAQNARLSADGATLYLHCYDHMLSLVDVPTGRVRASFPLVGRPLANGTAYFMTVAEGVPKGGRGGGPPGGGGEVGDSAEGDIAEGAPPKPTSAPVVFFAAAGQIAAFSTAGKGKLLFNGSDPTGATAFAPTWGVGHAVGSPIAVVSDMGNYLDVQGVAGVDATPSASGKLRVDWAFNWTGASSFVQASRYPTRQGTAWVRMADGSGYDSARLLALGNGSQLGTVYLPRSGISGLSFTSPMATSADGACQYHVGEAAPCDSCGSDVYLVAYCGAARGFAAVYNVRINELCHPDIRQVAVGPAAGQVAVWHQRGVVVYEDAGDTPPPPGPAYSALCRS